jgi:hypothetical protein
VAVSVQVGLENTRDAGVEMGDLKHWDFAENFTGLEIALLLIGCDPSVATELDIKRADHAQKKIRIAYSSAVSHQSGNPFLEDEKLYLKSKLLRWYEKHPPKDPNALPEMESLAYESQEFSRLDVARWIKSNALISQYEFELERETPKQYRERVVRTVEEHHGNQSAAGRSLGISPQRVGQLMREVDNPKTKLKSHSFLLQGAFNSNPKPRKHRSPK